MHATLNTGSPEVPSPDRRSVCVNLNLHAPAVPIFVVTSRLSTARALYSNALHFPAVAAMARPPPGGHAITGTIGSAKTASSSP